MYCKYTLPDPAPACPLPMPTDTRSRIVEAAGNLFYKHGFQAVGLDQILSEVGISKTALYKHFESKDEIILAVLKERDERDIAEALAYMNERGGDDPRRQILAFFDQLSEWFASADFRGCLFMNAATEFPSATDPIHRLAIAHGAHLSAHLRSRLVKAGLKNADSLTRQIMVLIMGAIAARHTNGVRDAAEAARETAATLLGLDPVAAS